MQPGPKQRCFLATNPVPTLKTTAIHFLILSAAYLVVANAMADCPKLVPPVDTETPSNAGTAASTGPATNAKTADLVAQLGVSPYESIYFIAGGSGGLNAKFQISFKYRIFSEQGWFARCLSIPSDIYLSYSQTSLWDLHERSSPFKDSSYRPRLFYLKENQRKLDAPWKFGIEAGLAHESNGKMDLESRSINTAYLRPTLSYYLDPRNRIYAAPMLLNYFDDEDNPDIEDYRGNVDLLFGFGSGNAGDHDWNFWTMLRKGARGHRGSIELNLTVPFKFITNDRLNGWLLLQYFSGQGESLLDYDKKMDAQFRAGFAIVVQ